MSSGHDRLAGDARSELLRRREALVDDVRRLRSDLGGLTYEMAIRDHFRIDVLVRRAAILQEHDAELAEVERLLSGADPRPAGTCPGCGAVRSRGAVFCWQCGVPLMERVPSATVGANAAARPGSSEAGTVDSTDATGGARANGSLRASADGGVHE